MRHLVMVVPGLGGSVLADKYGPVWDAGLGDIAGLITHPERLDVNASPTLTATGLITSKRWLPGWTVVHGYERLLAALGDRLEARVDLGDPSAPDWTATVAAFPYDFRRGIADAAEALATNVKTRLDALGSAEGEPRVIVVAHSLGGLIVRYWLGPLGGWKCCRAVVTLGTPHRGAPKALDWLVNGARVGPKRLAGATDLIRGWQSVFELLPRYQAVWDEGSAAPMYPYELGIGWFTKRAAAAFKVHEEIEAAWDAVPRRGPEVVAAVGWSHHTLLGARWDGERLRVSKATPEWVDALGWEQELGDGTVPATSAVPLEMSGSGQGLIRVRERHSPLVDARQVVDLIAAYEARGSIDAVRGTEDDKRQPAIGLDLEDAYLAGETLPLSIGLHNCSPTATTTVWATIRTRGVPGKTDIAMEPDDDGGFLAELPLAPDAGMHDLSVLATELAGAGELTVADSFATVEPA